MGFVLRETCIALLSLLLFVEILSIKDCCPKPLDPDAFRNVVSIHVYAVLAILLRVISIMRFSLAVYICVLIETDQLISLRCLFSLHLYHSYTGQVLRFFYVFREYINQRSNSVDPGNKQS